MGRKNERKHNPTRMELYLMVKKDLYPMLMRDLQRKRVMRKHKPTRRKLYLMVKKDLYLMLRGLQKKREGRMLIRSSKNSVWLWEKQKRLGKRPITMRNSKPNS